MLQKALLKYPVLRYAWYALVALLALALVALFVWLAGALPGMWL